MYIYVYFIYNHTQKYLKNLNRQWSVILVIFNSHFFPSSKENCKAGMGVESKKKYFYYDRMISKIIEIIISDWTKATMPVSWVCISTMKSSNLNCFKPGRWRNDQTGDRKGTLRLLRLGATSWLVQSQITSRPSPLPPTTPVGVVMESNKQRIEMIWLPVTVFSPSKTSPAKTSMLFLFCQQ